MSANETPAIVQNAPRPTRAYVVLACGIAAIAFASIFIALAIRDQMPAPVIAAGRLTLAALLLTPLALRQHWQHIRGLLWRQLAMIGVSGVFLGVHFYTWVSSLEHTSVLISAVLVTTTPLWLALMEKFFLKADLSRGVVVGLCVALVGGAVIGLGGANTATQTTGDPNLGAILSLIGALTVSVHMIFGRSVRDQLPLLAYLWMVYGVAALVLCAIVAVTATPVLGYSANAYVWVLLLALVPQLIGHSSLNYAVRYMPATYVGIAVQMEPLASAVAAFFILQQTPSPAQLLGSAVIFAGVLIATLWQTKTPQAGD
jgi:drug/metabolite transporter (DMT)-like permease